MLVTLGDPYGMEPGNPNVGKRGWNCMGDGSSNGGILWWVFLEGNILVGFHHQSWILHGVTVWHPWTQATGEIGTIDNYGAAVAGGGAMLVGIFSKNAMFLAVIVTGWVSIPWCSLYVEYDIMMS